MMGLATSSEAGELGSRRPDVRTRNKDSLQTTGPLDRKRGKPFQRDGHHGRRAKIIESEPLEVRRVYWALRSEDIAFSCNPPVRVKWAVNEKLTQRSGNVRAEITRYAPFQRASHVPFDEYGIRIT